MDIDEGYLWFEDPCFLILASVFYLFLSYVFNLFCMSRIAQILCVLCFFKYHRLNNILGVFLEAFR